MESLLSHCAAAISQNGGLFAVFFLGGLTGGFTHCLTMCGPIVAGQVACGGCHGACGGRRAQLANASQFQYHLGRAYTYTILGGIAALLSRQLATFSFWPWVSTLMLAIAGLMFIASSLPNGWKMPFQVNGNLSFTHGALLGFMPCGLLYAALMMAATLADPISGALAMLVFTIGTLPALLIASFGMRLLSQKWQNSVHSLGRAMMAFNGVSLLYMAGRIAPH